MPRVVLRRQLNDLADAGAKDDRLQVAHHAQAELESDVRAGIETEEAGYLVAETVLFGVAAFQIQIEPVREVKIAGLGRQPQRRREVDDRKVRFERIQSALVVERRARGHDRRRLIAGRRRWWLCTGGPRGEDENADDREERS